MNIDKVTFVKSDYDYPQLEKVADDFALFLFNASPSILGIFVEFMRTSTPVSFHDYKPFNQKFFSKLIKNEKKAPPDIKKLRDFCHLFFETCQTDDEIKKMRGLVPEKLFEKIFNKRHESKDNCHIDYGVKVLINNKAVYYKPDNPFETEEDIDKPRQSVDAGFWDGHEGEFAEVKLQPHAFRTKDIGYLRLLAEKLNENDISYCIFLVAFNNKELITSQLERLQLISKDNASEFSLIGTKELFQLGETA
ncbi:hypothetical protein [Lentibacillus sediminis]|uniref:hypothetical protein n=1 Tax=Lentibacillus sediminis TaxID=1940529 RepID=UPI000C1C0F71|nr:hypothetical protein [Lentibacillus sediminis]